MLNFASAVSVVNWCPLWYLPLLCPLNHIWDVMLVRRKENINRTVSVLHYCVLSYWCTMVRAVLTGRSTGLGFDLAWFSSLSSEHLCNCDLHDAILLHSLSFTGLSLERLALDLGPDFWKILGRSYENLRKFLRLMKILGKTYDNDNADFRKILRKS